MLLKKRYINKWHVVVYCLIQKDLGYEGVFVFRLGSVVLPVSQLDGYPFIYVIEDTNLEGAQGGADEGSPGFVSVLARKE